MKSYAFRDGEEQHGAWLTRSQLKAGGRDEKWLQALLFAKPDLVPLDEIVAGTRGYVPVCRELTIPKVGGSVFLDILGVTAEGRLVLIECKLWRNPQARREVIAQILEYASLLRTWTYSDMTARLKQSLGWTGANPLFEHARGTFPDIEEANFVDAVARSLRTGDFALIVAGDGIRSDVHAIAEHLNDTSGLASRLALLEIQLWEGSDGTVLAVPSIPVRTEVIEHRIVTLPTGEPVQLQRPDEPARDREPVAPASQDKDANRTFWQRYIDSVEFDHPDQPKPRHGGNNWVRIALPDPLGGMTAFRTRDGRAGIFFKVSGAEGQAALDALKPALMSNEALLTLPIEINEAGSGATFEGGATLEYPGDTRGESELLRWLQISANDLVNRIRPLLGQMERERGD